MREIGVSDKNIPYFCQKLLILLVKGGGGHKLAVLLVQNFHGMSLSL